LRAALFRFSLELLVADSSRPAASRLRAAQFRAERLAALRAFFAARGVLEVETPLLSRGASHDFHIDVFAVPEAAGPGALSGGAAGGKPVRYLQTSPEPHMKRLLARGWPDIYQIGKAFRLEEAGRLHNPEFTMAEWYRRGWKLRRMMEETVEACSVVAGPREAVFMLYVEAFAAATGLNPRLSSREKLLAHPVFAQRGLGGDAFPEKSDVLNFLMSEVVEPGFDPNKFTVIHHFPAELSSQAEPDQEEPFLVQRFEVYSGGMELGNGYKELIDAREYRARFEAENRRRAAGGKPEIPLHEGFFGDLGDFLPPCAGVAVGFDRLLMLGLGASDVREVVSFPWDEA
jgi:lysyl-tRNA synthetase class 2